MKRFLPVIFAGMVGAAAGPAIAQDAFDGKVKIGVLNDQSSLYADATGQGDVVAAQLALEDYMKANPNSKLKVEIIFADHQNKPDTGSAIARKWFEAEGVDLVLDVPNSGVALAVSDVAKQLNKVHINGSAGTTRMTGDLCNANTIQWTFDNYALAHGTGSAVVATGGKSWFFITADYAFGIDLEGQTSTVVKADGGSVLGGVRVPLNNADFSSFLLQAQQSKAQVIGLANAGGDTINAIKQASEFGIVAGGQRMAALLIFVSDIHSLGLKVAQGLQYTDAYYWDRDDASRAFAKRFAEKMNGKMWPGMNAAGNYSATIHFLKAMEAAKTRDGSKLVAKMKELPTDDPLFGQGEVRADGRQIHPMYLWEVKKPEESKGEWDIAKLVKTIPKDQAFRPLAQSECALVKK
jgi:branched-chain amino acid transport system substrate-binding protein